MHLVPALRDLRLTQDASHAVSAYSLLSSPYPPPPPSPLETPDTRAKFAFPQVALKIRIPLKYF